jgi:hypothetical protein
MADKLRIATLVKTVLVETIRPSDDAGVQFRIEVFSWSEQEYTCQVWRLDTYRIQPTFQQPSQLADEEVPVLDLALDWRELRADTAGGVLSLVFDEIERRFGVQVSRSP